MPFDGKLLVQDEVLALLEDGLAKVRGGWCQNTPYTLTAKHRPQSFCTLSAIGAFEWGISVYTEPASDLLVNAAGVASDNKLIWWNDDPDRTQADVIALYEKAILVRQEELLNG